MSVITEIHASSEELLKAHKNMEGDLAYLHDLAKQIESANARCVETGNVADLLVEQIAKVEEYIDELSVELNAQIEPLVLLEEQITRSDAALVFTKDMTPMQKFTAVHAKLKQDKIQLVKIVGELDEWNRMHDVTLDATPATDMIKKIDDAYKVFNQKVKALVKKASKYASLIKEEPEPVNIDTWAIRFRPHDIDTNTIMLTSTSSPALPLFVESLKPFATRVYDQDDSAQNRIDRSGHDNEWMFLYVSKVGEPLKQYNRWHSNMYSTSLYYKMSSNTCKLTIACYGLAELKDNDVQVVLSKTELDEDTLKSIVFTDLN